MIIGSAEIVMQNINDLVTFGNTYEFSVDEIPAQEIDDVSVSSTKIRKALEEGDIETLKEELGDLTLHVLFQAELARESGKFDLSDSLRHISEKLIQRHPQVFDKNNSKRPADDMNKSWEAAKQKEKQRENILDGVPKNLPALIRARRIQEKAANVGFDWDELPPVLDKIDEEMTELKGAVELKDPENIKDEMGDVLFSLVNLSRFLDINPEDALRMTISKFETRFAQVEKELKKRGKITYRFYPGRNG